MSEKTIAQEAKTPLLQNLKSNVAEIAAYGGLAVTFVLFLIFSGSKLAYNASVVLQTAAPYAIMSLGAVFIYSMGFMDVSASQQVGVYAILMIMIGNKIGGWPGMVLALITFVVYDQCTAAGRKGKILKNNQGAGVNIGIDEVKNCFVSYVFRGIIIGMATRDYIGIIMAAIGMAILNYGLSCMNLGAGGMQQIIMGVFVLGFYSFSAQLGNISKLIAKLTKKQVAA